MKSQQNRVDKEIGRNMVIHLLNEFGKFSGST